MKKVIIILSFLIFSSANADMSDNEKSKAWECSGIYMANYFLPSGESFEYSMKEKSMASVKVLKSYALEVGISEKEWDEGVNKAVDKHYGSKYDKDLKSIVNYSKLVRLIKKLVKNKHYNFLETLAEDVFDELFKDKRIGKISLQIEKLEIMKDCSSVGIQISKKRSHDKF